MVGNNKITFHTFEGSTIDCIKQAQKNTGCIIIWKITFDRIIINMWEPPLKACKINIKIKTVRCFHKFSHTDKHRAILKWVITEHQGIPEFRMCRPSLFQKSYKTSTLDKHCTVEEKSTTCLRDIASIYSCFDVNGTAFKSLIKTALNYFLDHEKSQCIQLCKCIIVWQCLFSEWQ